MTEPRRHNAIALAALTACITLLFADVLLGINGLYVRDVAHLFYPAKNVLRNIVLGGDFPSWNPFFNSGQPMAANPQHEVFYPLTWLILLPGYRFWFHILVIGHLYIAGWSMFALLRSMSNRAPAAFFGGLSFALGGLCLSYLNLLPILFAVAWLPLTCLYARRFILHRARRDFGLASFFFGLQLIVGEPSTIIQTGLLLGLYALYAGWRERRVRGAAGAVAIVALLCIAALLVGAVQILPAVDHASDSVRSRGLSFETVRSWSMPPARIAELLHPSLFGQIHAGPEPYWGRLLYPVRGSPFLYSIYPGLLLSLLAVAAFFARLPGRWLVLTIGAVSVLLAVGSHTPLWQFLFDSGIARSLRYPEKFMFLAVFALTVFGTRALEELLAGNPSMQKSAARTAMIFSAIALAIALFAQTSAYEPLFAALWQVSGQTLPAMAAASGTGWLLLALRGLAVLLLTRTVLRSSRRLWLGVAGVFCLLDLGMLMPDVAPRVPGSYYEPPGLQRSLPGSREQYRVFHHADLHKGRPEVRFYFEQQPDRPWIQRNALFGAALTQYEIRIAMMTDHDLTDLLPAADFNQSVIDLTSLRRDWVDIAASMSNVWYRLVFIAPDEALALAGGDRRRVQPVGVISLPKYPRYYFAGRVETIRTREEFVAKLADPEYVKRTALIEGEGFDPAPGVVRSAAETANTVRLEVEAEGSSFLVISVTPHKYWRITIDGTETPAIITNVGYQGITVPAGRHVVEMRYRNPLIPIGGAVTLGALLCIAFLVAGGRSRQG